MEQRLAELAAEGRLSARDLDVVYVASGEISLRAVHDYLAGAGPRVPLPIAAAELTERICGCQYHDGGRTDLVSVDHSHLHLAVAGACRHCPQIKYTMAILDQAIRSRAEDVEDVVIDGTDLTTRSEVPPGSQLTMPMLMRRTGMTFADIDGELDRKSVLSDNDLADLAKRCLLRRHYAATSDDDG